MSEHETFQKIRRVAYMALAVAELLVPQWLPEGKRCGSEWVARNPVRNDRRAGSFGVSLINGKWNDFAAGDAHGSDLVSLYAYLHDCRQVDAAIAIDNLMGFRVFTAGSVAAISNKVMESVRIERDRRDKNEKAEKIRTHREVARRAQWIWNTAIKPDASHPYLVRKALPPLNTKTRPSDGALLVPLHQDGKLINIQFINKDGQKRFLKGGRVEGTYSWIGHYQAGKPIFICEGWATGATLNHVAGRTVACAMTARNLEAVVGTLRYHYGTETKLIVMGDDDRTTKDNPGRVAAIKAAEAHGAKVFFPNFPDDCPITLSDFNDLYCWKLRHGPFAIQYGKDEEVPE